MNIDWALAGKVGGIGFGLVFGVLIVLASAIWLTGVIFKKLDSGREAEAGKDKKGV